MEKFNWETDQSNRQKIIKNSSKKIPSNKNDKKCQTNEVKGFSVKWGQKIWKKGQNIAKGGGEDEPSKKRIFPAPRNSACCTRGQRA